MTKSEHSRVLRYKRPALASLGHDAACNELLYSIKEANEYVLAGLSLQTGRRRGMKPILVNTEMVQAL